MSIQKKSGKVCVIGAGQVGATYHAIASATLNIVESITKDQNSLYSVSSYIEQSHGVEDVCLSVPSKINRNGVNEHVLLS